MPDFHPQEGTVVSRLLSGSRVQSKTARVLLWAMTPPSALAACYQSSLLRPHVRSEYISRGGLCVYVCLHACAHTFLDNSWFTGL